MDATFRTLAEAARAGRVGFSDFLAPEDAAALLARLKGEGLSALAWGGYPGARRRVVAAFPEEVGEALPPLTAWYVAGAHDEGELRAAAQAAGLAPGRLGDAVSHEDGLTLVTFAPLPAELEGLRSVAGRLVTGLEVDLGRLGGSSKAVEAVVPSLRVDVLGARAFGVSRSYFAKGVAAGRVSVNGKAAGKSASADVGDEVYAEGLGRFRVERVGGETRRGNLKVSLVVERS